MGGAPEPTHGATPVQPAPPPPPPGGFVPPRVSPVLTNLNLANLGELVAVPPRIRQPEPVPGRRTFTDLANEAIARLRAAPSDTLIETVRTLSAKQIPAANLLSWIERKTRVGEVLSAPASQWSNDTVADFAAAFQMDQGKKPVMDLIVAIATLNERELEAELRSENMPNVTAADLLQNRRVVFQYPPPGTELQPPYVILVAVEHQDLQHAADVVASIMGQLVEAQGYRMPRDAAARLG
jgi:hypothetical protein